jgi:spermidine synthase
MDHPPVNKKTQILEAVLFALMGGFALAGQVVLIREMLVVFEGNELCLGLFLAFWLLGIFVGAWIGGRLQGIFGKPLRTFILGQAMLVPLGVGLVFFVRSCRALLPFPPGVPPPLLTTALLSLASITPLSLVVGFLFPVACRAATHHSTSFAGPIGKVYIWEAFGSLIAGVLLTFWLIPSLDGLEIMAFCGLALWALLTVSSLMKDMGCALRLGLITIPALVFSGLGGVQALRELSLSIRWNALHPGMERLVIKDSRYQSLSVGRMGSQYTVFGNGRILSNFPDPQGSAFLVHLTMNQRPRPQDLLVIGGGPSSLLDELLLYPVRMIYRVELDPLAFKLVQPYLPSGTRKNYADKRVRWIFTDPRYALRKLPQDSVDAVILRVPDPSTALLNRLHTIDFYRDIKRVLRPRGFLVTSTSASVNYISRELSGYVGTVFWTLRQAFERVLVIPGDRAVLLASGPGVPLTTDPEVLSSRLGRQFTSPPANFPPDAFFFWIQKDRIKFWMGALLRTPQPVNSDIHPLAYLRFLTLWDLMTGRRFIKSPLRHLQALRLEWLLGALAALWAFLLLAMPRRISRGALLWCIAVTGFIGMTQEILCLYLYQTAQGFLYSRLGMIVAVFMAGLAGGGWLGSRQAQISISGAKRALFGVQGGILLLCMLVPLAWIPLSIGRAAGDLTELMVEVLVFAWMAAAGVATGWTFPLVCEIQRDRGLPLGQTAGVVDAMDHLGAAMGALIPGTFLVPTIGLAQTGWFLVGLQCLLLVILILYLLDRRKALG